MSRVWPIICQFGVGGLLCIVGIVCGLRGRYLDLSLARDRRFMVIFAAGFIGLLVLAAVFTFLAPHLPEGATP